MALITCPDCKKPTSSEAKACLSCGRPIKYWTIGRIILAILLGLIVFAVASEIGTSLMTRFGDQ